MATEIVVPALGESVTEATVGHWMKAVGDPVAVDDPLLELETDKVTIEVYAPAAGTLGEVRVEEGETVEVGTVLGLISEGGAAAAGKPLPAKAEVPPKESMRAQRETDADRPAPAAEVPARPAQSQPANASAAAEALAPAVRRLVEENDLEPAAIPATGKDGRLTKGDVLSFLEQKSTRPAQASPASARRSEPEPRPGPEVRAEVRPAAAEGREERVRMTRLRKRIAERLKQAQDTAAMLTTFNEVDMSAVMALRKEYRDTFEKKHGVKLGFMSFFLKACIVALKEIPAVNAEIDGDDIVYKNYYDIGVAVGTEQGLVVPVVRDADKLDFAGIEKTIAELGAKARDGKLTIEDLTGGTFTISNGGVYGSLMSTPILNPPQSGILGMHKTQMRPVAIDGKVEVRPMMYLALSYDHRIIDGREAVTFLVRVKECLEDPQRILLAM